MNIREIARQLGVGKSTVAYALQGGGFLSESMRRRIIAKARELGYEINPFISAVLHRARAKAGSLGKIAFILSFGGAEHVEALPPERARLHSGVLRRTEAFGYELDMIDFDRMAPAIVDRKLLSCDLRGVVIGPVDRPPVYWPIEWSRVSAVCIGHLTRLPLHRVVHNYSLGMLMALRACRDKGYRRIGLVLTEQSDRLSDGSWLSAYVGAQSRNRNAQPIAPLVLPGLDGRERRIANWMKEQRPQVVLFHNRAAVPAFLKSGPAGGGGVLCVLLDRSPSDPFAGINQCYESAGEHLVDAVGLQLLHNEKGIPDFPSTVLLEGRWEDSPALPAAGPSRRSV